MAYELVKPEGEADQQAEAEDPRFKKGWEPPPWAKVGSESWHQAWLDHADNGYTDSYNMYKKQMENTYMLYMDQLGRLPEKKDNLRKEKNAAWWHVFAFLLVVPAVMILLTQFCLMFGTEDAVWGIVYLVFKVLTVPVILVSVFFALPAAARDLVNTQWTYNVLTKPALHGTYRAKNDIVTFAEEEHFLKHRIKEIEDFKARAKREHLDQPAAGEDFVFLDEMSEKQQAVLDEMMKLAEFEDYQARAGLLRKKAGYEWLIMGWGIMFGLAALVLVFSGVSFMDF